MRLFLVDRHQNLVRVYKSFFGPLLDRRIIITLTLAKQGGYTLGLGLGLGLGYTRVAGVGGGTSFDKFV
jgi:hypothetical protein